MGISVHEPEADEKLALKLLEELHRGKRRATRPVKAHAERLPAGQRGLSINFLLAIRTFYRKHGGMDKMMDLLCHGDEKTSIVALTSSTGLSLAETIFEMGKSRGIDMSGLVGPATTYLSYSWIATNLESILSAVVAPKIVRQNTQDEESVSGKRFVWIDAFCASQNLTIGTYLPQDREKRRELKADDPAEFAALREDKSMFSDVADSVSELFFFCCPLTGEWYAPPHPYLQEGRGNPPADWVRKGPVAITRGWCFLEAAVLIAKGCTMNVVLRQEDIDSLEALLVEDLDRMVEVINTIDINEAQVTDIEDRDYIMGAMSKLPGGFEKVSQTLRTMLREWLIGEATAALNRMPEKDRGTSCLIDSLGSLLYSQQRFDEAEELLREALAACRRELGNRSESTLASIHNLGGMLQARGRREEAEPLLREALDITREKLGDLHENTLQSVNTLGILLQDLGRLPEAEVLLQEDLAGSRRILGHKHPDTIAAMNNLAQLLLDLGRGSDAEALYREAFMCMRDTLGDHHEHTLLAMANLGWFLQAQGKLEEAEQLTMSALVGMHETLGSRHLKTIVQTVQAGELLVKVGKLDALKKVLGDVPLLACEMFGEGHSTSKKLAELEQQIGTPKLTNFL